MPRVSLRLAALALLAAALAGCWPDDGPDYHGERAYPPDLTIRQSPGSTVRVGDTVTFTAVFRDSLNPDWTYNWRIDTYSPTPTVSTKRAVRWVAPSMPGEYLSSLFVSKASDGSRRAGYVRTLVHP